MPQEALHIQAWHRLLISFLPRPEKRRREGVIQSTRALHNLKKNCWLLLSPQPTQPFRRSPLGAVSPHTTVVIAAAPHITAVSTDGIHLSADREGKSSSSDSKQPGSGCLYSADFVYRVEASRLCVEVKDVLLHWSIFIVFLVSSLSLVWTSPAVGSSAERIPNVAWVHGP